MGPLREVGTKFQVNLRLIVRLIMHLMSALLNATRSAIIS